MVCRSAGNTCTVAGKIPPLEVNQLLHGNLKACSPQIKRKWPDTLFSLVPLVPSASLLRPRQLFFTTSRKLSYRQSGVGFFVLQILEMADLSDWTASKLVFFRRSYMSGDPNSLSFDDCYLALQQAFSATNFSVFNPHLSAAERLALRQNPIQWPAKPVFSPYSTTHNQYSQIRFKGTKFLIHRLSVRLFSLGAVGLDCSHTMHLGKATGRNFNPLHIVQESNEMNQTRKACAIFSKNGGGCGSWGLWVCLAGRIMIVIGRAWLRCVLSVALVHGQQRRCSCWNPAWGDGSFMDSFP